VGEHPHRGFETVTIAYQGEIEHRDSAGHKGRIGPGDVQWMTAAGGIVHEEMHGREFTKKGGTLEMVQLWVNLPARFKMAKPTYQDVVGGRTPTVTLPGEAGSVRVIAGEFENAKGPARTFTPIEVWDMRLRAGKTASLHVPAGQSTALLFLRGGGRVNASKSADEGQLVVLEREGETLSIEPATDATVLLLSGTPIDEPVAGYGPFVMNTEKEIRQAIADYRSGLMGHLD
jgi:redox-sensitive bicupin YhaK (pirin superfamily)